MKLSRMALCVALVTFLTLPALAQVPSSTDAVGAFGSPSPALTVTESVDGWQLDFSDMGSSRYLMLFVGADLGSSAVSLGASGSLRLSVSRELEAVLIGRTSPTGDGSAFIPRPKTLPPELEEATFAVQGMSFDPRVRWNGAIDVTDFLLTNAVEIKLVSTVFIQ